MIYIFYLCKVVDNWYCNKIKYNFLCWVFFFCRVVYLNICNLIVGRGVRLKFEGVESSKFYIKMLYEYCVYFYFIVMRYYWYMWIIVLLI